MISRRSFIKICASTLVSVSCAELFFQKNTSSGVSYRQIPVLAYHRVGYSEGDLTVTPERFESDLQALQDRGYCTISLEQFQNFMYDSNIELPEKPILITFDDGYLDNYEHAYPLLQQRGMVATFFIITDMLWTEERLTPENLVEMAEGGMSFGSHAVTHRKLGDLDQASIYDELVNSKAVLEGILGRMVNTIAYPQGSYNAEVVNIAQNVGYIMGLTTKEGVCLNESPDFELVRIPIFKYDSGILTVIRNRSKLA